MTRKQQFSTNGAAPGARHQAWSDQGYPSLGSVLEAKPEEGFEAFTETINVGVITIIFGWYGAQSIRRTERELQSQPLDVICLTMAGTMSLHGPGYQMKPGEIGVVDFSRPFEHYSTAGSLTSVLIPRPFAHAHGLNIATIHGRVIPAAQATLLRQHIFELRIIADSIPGLEEYRVARSIIDLLMITLAMPEAQAIPTAKLAGSLKARAEHLIINSLDHDLVTADILCIALSISRSTLYALYRDEHGVNNRIRRERLDRASVALDEPGCKIGAVAERFGFTDLAYFGKKFREQFGMTPSEWRNHNRGISKN